MRLKNIYLRFLKAWWALTHPRKRRAQKRILIVCSNTMTASAARHYALLFQDDSNVSVFVTNVFWHAHSDASSSELKRVISLRSVPFFLAVFRQWDLILFTLHGYSLYFSPHCKKCFISHGIDTAKIVQGEPYAYGRNSVLTSDKPNYDIITESSPHNFSLAVSQVPELENVIKLVGDLVCDELLKLEEKRAQIREELGIGTSDIAVMISSSWGRDSLFERHGEFLFSSIANASQRNGFKFLITGHPNLWCTDVAPKWQKSLSQLMVLDRALVSFDVSIWKSFAIAADIGISDHSSVNMYIAFLKRPIIFSLINGTNAPGSIIERIAEHSAKLNLDENLILQIEQALKQRNPEILREISLLINSKPGEARANCKAVFQELLWD